MGWYVENGKAGKMASKGVKRTLDESKKNARGYWASKKAMIGEFGEEKALSKIEVLNEIPDRHQPDPDTQKDGEWDREYWLYYHTEDKGTYKAEGRELQTEKDLENEKDKVEAVEDMDSVMGITTTSEWAASSSNIAPGVAGVKIKIEGENKTENAEEDKDHKLLAQLQETPKNCAFSRGCGDRFESDV